MENKAHQPKDKWKVTVAILGARMHYAVPSILAIHDRLDRLYTDWYIPKSGWSGKMWNLLRKSPFNILRRAAMRSNAHLPKYFVHSFHWIGMAYSLALRLSAGEGQREHINAYFDQQFAKSAAKVGFGSSNAVYGINSASVELFQAATSKNIVCVLEQCIAPYTILKKLLQEEYLLWPGWEVNQMGEINTEIARREKQEWELANLILAGSDFVKDGLVANGVSKEKCCVLPYGIDVSSFQAKSSENPQSTNLRVLFLGTVGLRKGIQYLYQALELTKTQLIETKAAGSISITSTASRQVGKRIKMLGFIPRDETRKLWQWADVLVIPSICEGSAMVTYEALAVGVPVIATPNTGSPVQDRETGFIVPNRNPEAIAERLDQLAANPHLRQEMGSAARRYAEEHLSWEAYGKRLIMAIQNSIQNREIR
jgi:glycosyltransferase involved in cell wall biosynthesis